MSTWKKNIFIRVISRRMKEENRTAEEIISEYSALTEAEKQEILNTSKSI
ncbi:hypothetical protein [Inediibacterium massiliense]|nr:hypothetical protein [Inediibacterium massiliense]